MSREEKDCLVLFRKQTEGRLGWGDSDNWNNSDFEKLSELIFEKTGVSLSISTLKRVWGKVKYDSEPTATTLNTLAQFSGYESWRNFCAQGVSREIEPDEKIPLNEETADRKNKLVKLVLTVVFLLPVATFIFFWMGFHDRSPASFDKSSIVFTSKTVSDELPNSVVFNYDLGKNRADSLFIQQSWDPSRREKIPASEHQHTSIYYYPGFFKAKLLINNTIVKEHEIFIKTKGWLGLVQPQTTPDVPPIYLSDNDINMGNGQMGLTSATLKKKTGKTVFSDVWLAFFNAKEYNVDPGSFTFSATLQNTSSKEEAPCRQVKINIVTTEGVISLPLCSKGCISDITVKVADVTIDGKSHDLSGLGCDFSRSVSVQVRVKDHQATVMLDGKQVLNVPYTKGFGRIVNLVAIFEGPGTIQNIGIE